MGSFSISEIITILVVILVIFGPNRLPEFARKTGRLIAQARQAVAAFTAEFESDYGDTVNPIRDLTDEIGGFRQDLTKTVTSLGAAVSSDPSTPPDGEAPEPGDERAEPGEESGDSESDASAPIAAVPDAVEQRIEPITIEDLIADATAGDPAKGDLAAGEVPAADSGKDAPSTDEQPGEVA